MSTLDPAVAQAQIATLQREIFALQMAIVKGVTRISYDGKSVDYDSLQELKMRLNFAQNLLNSMLGIHAPKPKFGRVMFTSGYVTRPLNGAGTFII